MSIKTHIKTVITRINILRQKFYIIPVCILIIYALTGIFAPLLSPHSPYELSLTNISRSPFSVVNGTMRFLGTDTLGRDFLSRLIYGTMISFKVTIMVVLINTGAGSMIGIMSGYFGGWIDSLLMRITDIGISIPWMIIVFFVAAITGPSMAAVVISMTLFGWSNLARTLRAGTLRLRNSDFVAQARINGCSSFRIIFKHILPNLLNTIIIMSTMSVPYIILTEGILSYLQIGIPTVNPSWGTLIHEGSPYAWWLMLFPAVAIFLVVYSFMYIGDRLQDLRDPDIN